MFSVKVDLKELKSLEKNFQSSLESSLDDASKSLSAMAYAKATELAQEKLHSRRQMFLDALSLYEEDGIQVLALAASARWIDDGQSAHNQLDYLLTSPKAKLAKDGSKYLIVPFEHDSNVPSSSQPMVAAVKRELKKRKIPFKKIERDHAGRPLLGRLHSFDINNRPLKTKQGPGQGHGPLGGVRQGISGIPFLQGVSVYQRNTDAGVKKSSMTFRVASSKQYATGEWKHPGNDPVLIIDEVYKWAQQTFENEIIPQILTDFMERL